MATKREQFTLARASMFYSEHKSRPFFHDLMSFITSGFVTAMVLARTGAIKKWRNLMGPTNSLVAKQV